MYVVYYRTDDAKKEFMKENEDFTRRNEIVWCKNIAMGQGISVEFLTNAH